MDSEATKRKDYQAVKNERQKCVDAILNDPSKKKIVVAGPGTGKTYLFKQMLVGKEKALTLTFVNALVEDLSLDLCGLSEVKTLHSFARSALTKFKKDVSVFPKLLEVIREDSKILTGDEVDFNYLFHNLEESPYLDFYQKRKEYYGCYGYSDIIFEIVKCFEKEKSKIPSYEQILVDEFQDFNKLEVALIDLLAENSPILLAGDDDQALYDFKSASAEHIRDRHCEANQEYTSFSLPYCSRCTQVIVEAANDIIREAKKIGFLNNRIEKRYEYFDEEKKDKESEKNPKVCYQQAYAKQMPWTIAKLIEKIAEQEKGSFSVLIISPTKLQSKITTGALRYKGFANIKFVEREGREATVTDGLKLLIEDENSNLGWRIAAKCSLPEADFAKILKETNNEDPKKFSELLETDFKNEIKSTIKVLKIIGDNKKVDKETMNGLLEKIGTEPYDLEKKFIKQEFFPGKPSIGNLGLKKIPLTATTIQSSKGLSADYVFITYFDDQYFIRNKDKTKISDQDICNFLVALTRAKKKVFLLSSNQKEPTFLKWIDKSRLEKV